MGLLEETEPLLLPEEVAQLLRVDRKTVLTWAAKGLIASIKLPNTRLLFRESTIRAIIDGGVVVPDEADHRVERDVGLDR